MWFQFPQGTRGISVAQQEFKVEVEDNEGRTYFRAPDHFAGIILELPGFRNKNPPDGSTDLADLPQADPLRDSTISQLSARVTTLETENEDLRRMTAETHTENVELKKRLTMVAEELEKTKRLDTDNKAGKK